MEPVTEIDPIEMMVFCIAIFEHASGLPNPLPGVDDGAMTAAMSALTAGVEQLGTDPAVIEAIRDEVLPIAVEMPIEDLQEGAAFCIEMADGA